MADPNPMYDDYKVAQSNVWLAMRTELEINGKYSEFVMKPMEPGIERRVKFGPEVAMGHRFNKRTGKRAMIVKLCSGGTDVEVNWNPDTETNNWDRELDDGTAAFLDDRVLYNPNPNGGDLITGAGFENHMYINLVHHTRMVTEELNKNDIPFVIEAFFWQQGSADKERSYKDFGADTARLFKAIRADIGVPNRVQALPIVDTGAGNTASMRTAKRYAHQLLCGINVVYTSFGTGWQDQLNSNDCKQGTRTGQCPSFLNISILNEFGWEPEVLVEKPFDMHNPDEEYKLNDFTNARTEKSFAWYSNYPNDTHAAYENIILQGIMFMDKFLYEFTGETPFPGKLLYPQGLHQYSTPECPYGKYASRSHQCWADIRTIREIYEDNPKECPYYLFPGEKVGSGRSLAIELYILGFALVFTMYAEVL